MLSSTEKSSERSIVKSVETFSKDQSAGPWRSNLCLPYEHRTHGGKIPQHVFESSGVVIPIDGWYAFCFGRGDGIQCGGGVFSPNHNLLLLNPSLPNNINDMLQYPLPLTHQTSSKKKQKDCDKNRVQHLTCTHIGKLMYLKKNARLLVVQNSRGEVDRNPARTLVDSNTQCQWFLVHAPNVVINSREAIISSARQLQTEHTDDQATSHTKQIVPEQYWAIGSFYESRLACSRCVRTFRTVRAVLAHFHESHSNRKINQRLNQANEHSQTRTTRNNESCDQEMWTKPLRVLYEDDVIACVVKPQGMVVMGSSPSLCRSNLLMQFSRRKESGRKRKRVAVQTASLSNADNKQDSTGGCHEKSSDEEGSDLLNKPVPVHRLDAATGGLLVIAKTRHAESTLRQSFAAQLCQKRYRAFVFGRLYPSEGTIDKPIDGRKPAHTRYHVVGYYFWRYSATEVEVTGNSRRPRIASNNDNDLNDEGIGKLGSNHSPKVGGRLWCTAVDLYPKTGRRHQLRKHMKSLGHPIVGDARYDGGKSLSSLSEEEPGDPNSDGGNSEPPTTLVLDPCRLYLWAMELTFPHPTTGRATTCRMEYPPQDWPVL